MCHDRFSKQSIVPQNFVVSHIIANVTLRPFYAFDVMIILHPIANTVHPFKEPGVFNSHEYSTVEFKCKKMPKLPR